MSGASWLNDPVVVLDAGRHALRAGLAHQLAPSCLRAGGSCGLAAEAEPWSAAALRARPDAHAAALAAAYRKLGLEPPQGEGGEGAGAVVVCVDAGAGDAGAARTGRAAGAAAASLLFERLGASRVALVSRPVCAALAAGFHSGLVLDVGAQGSRATFVCDAVALGGTAVAAPGVGGASVDAALRESLRAPFGAASEGALDALLAGHALPVPGQPTAAAAASLLEEMKLLCCACRPAAGAGSAAAAAAAAAAALPATVFVAPDGARLTIPSPSRTACYEHLFAPPVEGAAASGDGGAAALGPAPSLVALAVACRARTDVDIRCAVTPVVVTGGTSAASGFGRRLHAPLRRADAGFDRAPVFAAGPNAVWSGAAMVASQAAFAPAFCTAAEHREDPQAVVRKMM